MKGGQKIGVVVNVDVKMFTRCVDACKAVYCGARSSEDIVVDELGRAFASGFAVVRWVAETDKCFGSYGDVVLGAER